MFEETCTHKTAQGVNFIEYLNSKGIISGIKVDKGLQDIPTTDGESSTKGLDSLAAMCKKHYDLGCRFAKWRSVLKITANCPTDLAIWENAWGLARYAAIC
jgi:fructose-bisphosphate aldolase, class I